MRTQSLSVKCKLPAPLSFVRKLTLSFEGFADAGDRILFLKRSRCGSCPIDLRDTLVIGSRLIAGGIALRRSSQGRRVCRRTTSVILYSQILRSNRSARAGAVSCTGVKHELSSVMIALRARSIGLLKDILINYLRSAVEIVQPIELHRRFSASLIFADRILLLATLVSQPLSSKLHGSEILDTGKLDINRIYRLARPRYQLISLI